MITEADFYRLHVRPHLDQWGDHCRVENTAESGTPDISYAINGIQGWIETKVVRHGKMHFERFQPAWMKKRLRHSLGNVWVFAADEAAEQLFIYRADDIVKAPKSKYKDWLVVETKDVQPYVYSATRPWPWGRVLLALVGKL
jgi:hypothetical protein